MSELLQLPYFSQDGSIVRYLGQYEYASLDGLDLHSPSGERFLLSEGIAVRRPDLPRASNPDDSVIVLEPHCDDLALSASGYVMDAVAQGKECQSINLFSRTAIDRFPWGDKVTLSEDKFEILRLQESRLAIEDFLGQHFSSLQLPLASKRGYAEIFADNHRDEELVQEVGEMIAAVVLQTGAHKLLSPLAVQGHIDHLVTFDVGMFVKKALGDRVELILYEDYPYSRNKTAYAARLKRVKDQYNLQAEYIAVDAHLNAMSDMAIIYRSQFDDLNRDQMHAIMREDVRAVALEAKAGGIAVGAECVQRYWRVL